MKYIVDTDDFEPLFKVDSIGVFGIGKSLSDSDEDHSWSRIKSVGEFEELNSDYINEHYGDLQDTAYQKGFEDGKREAESSKAIEQAKADAFNKGMLFKEEKIHDAFLRGVEKGKAVREKGCEGCEYEEVVGLRCRCCANRYPNQWTAKQTDDEIKVGDEVVGTAGHRGFVTKPINSESVYVVWEDGSCGANDLMDLKKTGRTRYDIERILEAMKHD